MEGKDNIKELFSQKLGNYEAPVNPELWAKISSQVAAGATTTAASTGLSVFAKVAIGLGISAAAITTVVILSSSPEEVVSEQPTKEVQKETPTSTTQNNKEQVAELDEPVIIESIENDNLGTVNTDSSEGTDGTVMPNMYRSPEIEVITDPDFVIPKMEIRNPGVINEGGSSEPEIVEGIAYAEVTQYGSTTEEVEEIIADEQVVPKIEPIKRFVNVFTPNGDGENDEFFLESKGLTGFSVVVLNPNGDIVFQSSDPAFRWDGRDIRSGEKVESGNYMYMVSAYDSQGNPYPIYERLTIIVN